MYSETIKEVKKMNEIENLRILVDSVARKITGQVEHGDLEGLKSLLWNVPTNILADFIKEG